MITLDALAREIGCSVADINDLAPGAPTLPHRALLNEDHADRIRAAWSERTGIDYTKAAQ